MSKTYVLMNLIASSPVCCQSEPCVRTMDDVEADRTNALLSQTHPAWAYVGVENEALEDIRERIWQTR